MSLRKLPEIKVERVPGLRFEVAPKALDLWIPEVHAQADGGGNADENVIDIMDIIGDTFFGEGVSARSVSRALAQFGAEPVTVNINSPGGDFFEGLAIYNVLRQHKAKVTANVLGLAASAASIIAMAGDEVAIPKAAFIMIHKTWGIAIGNETVFTDIAQTLRGFDKVLAGVYVDRTGLPEKDIMSMLDAETFINGVDAVDKGFADTILAPSKVTNASDGAKPSTRNATRRMDTALAHAGLTRAERRTLIRDFLATKPGAEREDDDTPRAVDFSGLTLALERASQAIANATPKG